MAKRAAGGKIWAQNYGLCPQLSTKRAGNGPAAHGPFRPRRVAQHCGGAARLIYFAIPVDLEVAETIEPNWSAPVKHIPTLSQRRSRPVAAGCAQVQLEGRAFSERRGAVV